MDVGTSTVSYTHLDVYKRQAQAHGPERTTFEHLHPELKRHRETTQLYALGLALAADCPPRCV